MSTRTATNSKAFGVEPGFAPYSLRQARYHALAEDVARFAETKHSELGHPLDVLDIGVHDGVSRRYIEVHPSAEHIRYHAADTFPEGEKIVYKHRDWSMYKCDLEQGLVGLETDRFDVVICEQVLEHLHNVDLAAAEIIRVLKPRGLLIIGVPIFPRGAHLVRRHVVPVTDRLFRVKKIRSHVQAFSQASFLRLLRQSGDLSVQESRGFRIVSGGILRPLENRRWWWKLNRWIGSIVPSLCIEIQVLATKTRRSASWQAGGLEAEHPLVLLHTQIDVAPIDLPESVEAEVLHIETGHQDAVSQGFLQRRRFEISQLGQENPSFRRRSCRPLPWGRRRSLWDRQAARTSRTPRRTSHPCSPFLITTNRGPIARGLCDPHGPGSHHRSGNVASLSFNTRPSTRRRDQFHQLLVILSNPQIHRVGHTPTGDRSSGPIPSVGWRVGPLARNTNGHLL